VPAETKYLLLIKLNKYEFITFNPNDVTKKMMLMAHRQIFQHQL